MRKQFFNNVINSDHYLFYCCISSEKSSFPTLRRMCINRIGDIINSLQRVESIESECGCILPNLLDFLFTSVHLRCVPTRTGHTGPQTATISITRHATIGGNKGSWGVSTEWPESSRWPMRRVCATSAASDGCPFHGRIGQIGCGLWTPHSKERSRQQRVAHFWHSTFWWIRKAIPCINSIQFLRFQGLFISTPFHSNYMK